ncbi:Nuclear cap-binding protein complex subunit 1 [Pichia kudriavzevii]|uniref:Nuclear cap-binding protein complex subunit 1 n=1 Tax=Pichia kudriavzevii TaxID=4909 RepID=A0A099P1G9_PICKU|nr:hypothetical protein JL09_g1958 [Pichia kudriavzevii]ONH72466.1 Nuclear cap-binding protein complex subunit 1 [Pichia kudriavzevii]
MSEEYSRKRQRVDDDIGYAPLEDNELPPHLQDNEDVPPHLQNNEDVPPHLQNNEDVPPHLQNNEDVPPHLQYNEKESARSESEQAHGQEAYNPKRQRQTLNNAELERAQGLCQSLQTLGDVPYEVKVLYTQGTETIVYLWHDDNFRNSILRYFGAVIIDMPHKANLFSGLILLANAKMSKVGEDVIQWLKARLVEVFDDIRGDSMEVSDSLGNNGEEGEMRCMKSWNRVILIFRMFGLLSPMIQDFESIVKLAKDLIDYSIQLQNGSEERVALAELLYYEMLISLPYCLANEKGNKCKEQLKKIIESAKQFNVRVSEGDEKFKPIVQDAGELVAMSEILKDTPQVVDSYLDEMNLFYDVSHVVDPLIRTVLAEKKLVEEKSEIQEGENEQEGNQNGPEIEEKVEHTGQEKDEEKTDDVIFATHTVGTIEIPSAELLDQISQLDKYASIADTLWKHPRYVLNIFPYERQRQELDFDTLPPAKSYASMLLNDVLNCTLINMEYNRVVVSKQILNYPLYFNEKAFCKPNSPLDKLMIIDNLRKGIDFDLIKNLEESSDFDENIKQSMIASAKRIQDEYEQGFQSTWKMEEIVLTNIINLIFLIPQIELPPIYFETLVEDTCGRDWTLVKRYNYESNESLVFSKVVGDSFRYLYENVEKLRYENIVKFVNWFVLQVSNFKFEWEWQEWVPQFLEIGDSQIYHPKVFFIRNAIHKEILITNYKFIKSKTLPEELRKYANLSLKSREELVEYDCKFFGTEFAQLNTVDPFENEEDNYGNNNGDDIVETNTETYKLFSHYLFNHDEHPFNDICRDVYMNLENVEDSNESLLELIDRLKERVVNEGDVKNANEYIVTLVLQSVCLIGSRSFSVFEESLNKVFGDKLKSVLEHVDAGEAEKKEWIINAVLRIWNSEPRIGLMFLERLARYHIIDEGTLVRYVWNYNCLPLREVYADEFLERLIDDREDLNLVYLECLERQVEKSKEDGDEYQCKYLRDAMEYRRRERV